MAPKVSVIVPIYNAEDYLGQCLDSILTQTLEDIEVICVDDGSTDDTSSILQTYAFLDSRLTIVKQKNKGVASARNLGLKKASGEYVVFLDADDFFENNMLEKMVTKAQEDNSDVVMCGYYIFDNAIKTKIQDFEIETKYLKKSPFKPEDLANDLLDISTYHAWNKLIKRELIEKKGISFDERVSFAEDQLFDCCILTAANKVSVVKECYVYWRINLPMQLSVFKGKHFQDTLKITSFLYDKIKTQYGDKYLPAVCNRMKQLLKDVLTFCTPEQKRKGLMQIRNELSSEILDKLFQNDSPTTPKVSIIIPVYNAADFLPKCLDNCINQTLKEIEIICVDDGSIDNSLEILNQYAQKDKRIVVIHQENQRQAIARNKALDVASGRFIQFVDADDWIDLDSCECLYLYSSLFDLEMCQLGTIQAGKNIPGGSAPSNIFGWLPKKLKPVFNKNDIPDRFACLIVAACFTFYNHTFLIQNKIRWINKKIAYEDTPFFVESILKAKRVGILDIPFYHRYNHSNSTEHQSHNNFNEYIEIIKYTLEKVETWSDKESIIPYCIRFSTVAFKIFNGFEITDKTKMSPYLCDLLSFMQEKFCFFLDSDFYKMCSVYYKNKSLKEKAKFYFYRIKSYCVRNNYTINLFSYQKKPFYIMLLGIPALYLKMVNQKPSPEDIKNKILHQNIYVKLFGVTVFKTKKVIPMS